MASGSLHSHRLCESRICRGPDSTRDVIWSTRLRRASDLVVIDVSGSKLTAEVVFIVLTALPVMVEAKPACESACEAGGGLDRVDPVGQLAVESFLRCDLVGIQRRQEGLQSSFWLSISQPSGSQEKFCSDLLADHCSVSLR